MFPEISAPEDQIVLEVRGLSSGLGYFSDVNFSVAKGEILGIAGLVGAGRTELVRAMVGVDPLSGGQVLLDGQDISPRSPKDAIRNGIILVPEDRKQQGLVLQHSIGENFAYANMNQVARKGWFTKKRAHNFADVGILKFGVKGISQQNADELSGGNQQKAVIAKWLARNPRVVVLDEPTRGIDVGARSSIYDIIVGLAAEGVSIIIVSSDLEEVLGVSNRVMVMAQGRQAGILKRNEANDVSVMELATK
jgi:ribose transport system ATP-binding protein